MFCKTCDGNAQGAVEHCERRAGHEPQLPVGNAQIALDGLCEDGDDLAIEKIEDVNQKEQADRVAAITGRDRLNVPTAGVPAETDVFCMFVPPSSV